MIGMRLTILGGGGFRVPLIHRAVAARPELGIDEIVLHDVDPARSTVIAAVLAAAGDGPRVSAEASLEAAVAGSDMVFSAIRVGGAAGRVRDERRALAAGVLGQETVGAGGLAFALRTLPVALEQARVVRAVTPDAWLINFTNPAGLVTEGLRTVLGDRVVGICDSPIGLIRRACRALGVDAAQVQYDYLGINHLGWLRSLRIGNRELLPQLLSDDHALESFEEGRLFGGPLLRALGALPNEYAYFYYAANDLLRKLEHAPTRGEVVAADQSAFYAAAAGAAPAVARALWADTRLRREESYLAETRAPGEQRDQADLAGGGYEEVAVDLIGALSAGRPTRAIVNVPNGSAVPQLPADLVLEVPCLVDSGGPRPLPVAPPELHQLGLMASVRAAERAVITAIIDGSREQALRALTIHPLIGSPRVARELLDTVLTDYPQLGLLLT